jgi:hypothetical protein
LTGENRLSHIDYAYACWLLLTELEKCAYDRNQAIRDFQARASSKQSKISAGLALVAPAILWSYLLIFGTKSGFLAAGNGFQANGTRLIGLFTVTIFVFLIVFMMVRSLWTKSIFRPIKKTAERKNKARLKAEVKAINAKSRHIVESRAFPESRIPEDFLSAEILPLLIRYLESGQATTLKEAVYSLKLEFQNAKKHANLLLNESLLKKERKFLENEDQSLEYRIMEGEKA